MRYIYLLFFYCLLLQPVLAQQPLLDIHLHEADLRETLQFLANKEHKPVVFSKNVAGAVSIDLKQVSAKQIYYSILKSRRLAEYNVQGVWYVAPEDDLLKDGERREKWLQQQEQFKRRHLKTWRLKYGNAAVIAKILRDQEEGLLSKNAFLKVDERSSSVCIIDTDDRLNRANILIKQLDVPVQQFLIEARMVSIDQSVERELGISFGLLFPESKSGSNKPNISSSDGYSFAVSKLANGTLLDIKLSALEKEGRAELISSPILFASNQQPAFIESGEEVPYQEVSESGGTAVAFKKAVIGLSVTPSALPGNRVLLSLEISQDRPGARLVQGVPTINTQRMKTSVVAINGQTIVLGGIYENDFEKGQHRLPFISQIPLLGHLFEQVQTRTNKRELLIFVTPKVVK